ncbi:hypothetical protein C8J27_103294 [Rhodobacter aestuarii]|uniref:Uncharacterized protein n=1 Tax=Rhodobacter aestuarii TaxID=453582 RepID=A0A1N7JWK7_9RHOB|nr:MULTISPECIES: hypothetical protein [Rhodobacter]PTV95963.1 hypothetical protein C8J27_103294 [Rhodobacter aestuarii]SIS53584.1 hypothetical protein SAMN05421580_102141 [Rhodobacter aestuarii]SOC10554.1 hypothetical protein SAMN05877809_105142 [Rhodobacter sp. JA431]
MLKSFGMMVTALVSGVSGAAFLATSQDHFSKQPQAEGPQLRIETAALSDAPALAPAPIRLISPTAPSAEEARPELSPAALEMPAAPVLVANLPASASTALAPLHLPAIAIAEQSVPLTPRRYTAAERAEWPRPVPAPWRGGPIAQDDTTGYVAPYLSPDDMITPLPDFDAAEPASAPALRRMRTDQPDFNPWRTGVYR